MDCDQIRELLEAYALGALDPGEQTSVQQHLATCPECERLADVYADVAAMLPQALGAASPLRLPPSLKGRLLQSLESASSRSSPVASQEAPAVSEAARTMAVAAVGPAPDGTSDMTARAPTARRWPSRQRPRTLTVLAVLVLLALSLAWSARLSVALARERALRAEFANLVSQQELVLEVVDSSQTIRRVLRPPESGSRSYGKLFTRPDMPHVVAMAARLPQPPPGQTYHLWLTSEGQTRLAGEMAINDEGFGLLVFEAHRDGPVYEAALVTLQPQGSTQPTGRFVLRWEASE